MNVSTIVVLIIIATLFILSIRKVVKNRGTCSCGCSDCKACKCCKE